MKFVAFRRKRVHPGARIRQIAPRNAVESLSWASGVPHQAHTHTELRQQIHDDLRLQYPEWIQPNGESPLCDAYETRFMELLDPLMRNAEHESVWF